MLPIPPKKEPDRTNDGTRPGNQRPSHWRLGVLIGSCLGLLIAIPNLLVTANDSPDYAAGFVAGFVLQGSLIGFIIGYCIKK